MKSAAASCSHQPTKDTRDSSYLCFLLPYSPSLLGGVSEREPSAILDSPRANSEALNEKGGGHHPPPFLHLINPTSSDYQNSIKAPGKRKNNRFVNNRSNVHLIYLFLFSSRDFGGNDLIRKNFKTHPPLQRKKTVQIDEFFAFATGTTLWFIVCKKL